MEIFDRCPKCGKEIEECFAYTVSWGHRHSGKCDGYLHKETGKHEC